MKRILGTIAVACALIGLATSAQADRTMSYTRTISGLDPDGYFIPGTTTIDVVISINSVLSGADVDPSSSTNFLNALGVHETLPGPKPADSTNWKFAKMLSLAEVQAVVPSVSALTPPDVKPTANNTGELGFAYINAPQDPATEYPAVFGYRITIPASELGPQTITGFGEYRTTANSINFEVPTPDKVFTQKPTTLSLTRTLSGPGVTGSSNQFYVPGQLITETVTLFKDGPQAITALGLHDIIPANWTYAGFAADPSGTAQKPDVKPMVGDTGTMEFAWINEPVFPATFAYNIMVPADEAAQGRNFSATLEYRLGGAPLFSNSDNISLDGAPCTAVTMAADGGNFYAAGGTVTIVPTITTDCTVGITALGLYQTVPNTPQVPTPWTYAGLASDPSGTAQNPDVKPSTSPPATGDLNFAFINPIVSPAHFGYKVNVPADAVGDQHITGYVEYRLGGGPLHSEAFDLVLSGDQPPVITLNGSATQTVDCGSGPFVDPGATASDVPDGDISANIVTTGAVDTTHTGDYIITYDVTDSTNNAAVQVSRTVTVQDITAPTIALNGLASVAVECGSAYTEAGATATDTCDTALTTATPSGTVNTTSPGDYVISYDAQDASGNSATTVTRTVTVVDSTPPTITLLGTASITIECHSVYTDAGATASDTCDGNITASLLINGSVDANTPGDYPITFDVKDSSNNSAAQKVRVVHVRDTTKPVIALVGAGTVTIECGSAYSDLGANATDTCDGTVAVTNNSGTSVNESQPGNYTVTYTATDASGNSNTATRTVQVRDTTNPVLTLNGSATVVVECGSAYTDANGTGTDTCDSSVTVTNNAATTVDASNPGTYHVTVTAADDSGNTATATRTVTVQDTIKPVLTLTGSASVTVECGGTYTDAGATATDGCDGNLTGAIVLSGSVNTAVPNTYTLTYNVSDSSGNAATPVTRSVVVSDTVKPVVTLNGAATQTVECGGSFTDAGATAADTCDGDLTSSIVVGGDTVNTAASGTYVISYTVADAAGNTGTASRTITVSDTTKPVIAINGGAATIECGTSYSDAGANATDTCDGTVAVTTDASAVLTSTPGAYLVNYTAVDAGGNTATASRTVTVTDTTPPVVTLNGTATVTIDCTGTFTDPGATAIDTCAGSLQTTVSGAVNNSVEGDYVLTYTANDGNGNAGTATRTVHVNSCIKPCDDVDGNGISDGLFQCLTTDGANETLNVNGGTCERRVYAQTWFGDTAGDDVSVSVTNPNDENQTVTVSVARGVIGAGDQAILVLSIACTLDDLLGDAAFNLGTTPDGVVAGNAWFDVAIVVSSDGGATFHKLDNSILATSPVTVSIDGLNASADASVSLQSYETYISDSGSGPGWNADQGSSWSSTGLDCSYDAGTITCQVTHLSVFGAFETLPEPAALEVTPDPAFELVVGIAQQNKETVSQTVTLKNVGGGTLTGTVAKTGADFSIGASDGTFSIAAGATKVVTVSFKPTKLGAQSGTLTITPSVGAPVTVTLKGTGTLFSKRFQIFSCAPGGPASNSFGGDLAVVAIALGGLFVSTRSFRRAKQN